MVWKTIDTAPKTNGPFGPWLILGHDTHKWIRFGRYYPMTGIWYYSGTNERSQYYNQKSDEPTHWMEMPDVPKSE